MAASEAVKLAIVELEQEQARIGEALDVLKRFAGSQDKAGRILEAAPRTMDASLPVPCPKCGKMCGNARGLKLHVARKH
jgi:hypothetical protein